MAAPISDISELYDELCWQVLINRDTTEIKRLLDTQADGHVKNMIINRLYQCAISSYPALEIDHDFVSIINILLEEGACVNNRHALRNGKKQEIEYTPITQIARTKKHAYQHTMIQLLITHGGDVNLHDLVSPLMYASFRKNNVGLMQMLVQNGADIGWTNKRGHNVFTYCRLGGCSNNMAYLMSITDEATRPHSINTETITAVMFSVRFRQISTIEYILAQGVDIRVSDSHGQNALHYALEKLNQNPLKSEEAEWVIETLVRMGCGVNKVSNRGLSIIEQAMNKGNLKIILLLIQAGACIKTASYRQTALAYFNPPAYTPISDLVECLSKCIAAGGCLIDLPAHILNTLLTHSEGVLIKHLLAKTTTPMSLYSLAFMRTSMLIGTSNRQSRLRALEIPQYIKDQLVITPSSECRIAHRHSSSGSSEWGVEPLSYIEMSKEQPCFRFIESLTSESPLVDEDTRPYQNDELIYIAI